MSDLPSIRPIGRNLLLRGPIENEIEVSGDDEIITPCEGLLKLFNLFSSVGVASPEEDIGTFKMQID